MDFMYGYVYMTENLVNGKKYIGKHRAKDTKDDRYLGSGNTLLMAIKKYGRENFSRKILAVADSKEELNVLEIAMIAEYDAVKNTLFYNIARGGDGCVYTRSAEHLTKLASKMRRRWEEMSPEERAKMIEVFRTSNLGKPKSPEHRAKISAAKTGISNWTPETIASMVAKRKAQIAMGIGVPPMGNRGNKDYRHDEESKKRIRIGIWQARNRIAEERGNYHTEEGMISMLEKLAEYYTPEKRQEHAELIRQGHARKKAEYEAQGIDPPRFRWFYNPLNTKQRVCISGDESVPRGWKSGMGPGRKRKIDLDYVITLINKGQRNCDIAREVGCAASRISEIRSNLESK